jgi:hypothetical protein
MFTGDMLVISIFMTTATNFGISRCIAFEDSFMVGAMAGGATNRGSVRTRLPLINSGWSLLFVALDAIFSRCGCCEAGGCRETKSETEQSEQTQ